VTGTPDREIREDTLPARPEASGRGIHYLGVDLKERSGTARPPVKIEKSPVPYDLPVVA